MSDFVDEIIAYEAGELGINETLQLFANLIKTGMVNRLQGHYGRTAIYLVENGQIDLHGNVLGEEF